MRHIILTLACLILFVSSSLSQNWKTVYPFKEYNIYHDVWMSGDGAGYQVGKNGRVIQTLDNGISWEQIASAGSDDLIGVHYFDTTNQMITFSTSTVFLSGDSGATWMDVSEGVITEEINYHHIENNHVILFSSEHVYFSIDAGTSWTQSTWMNEDEEVVDIKIINEDLCYLMTKSGMLYKSADQGVNWDFVSEFDFMSPTSKFDFVDSNVGLAFIQGNKLYRTSDGGSVWEQVLFSGTLGFAGTVFEMKNENEIYVLANGTSFNKSIDGGLTWTNKEITSYGYERFSNYHIDNQDVFWCVGTYQVLGKSTDQGESWSDVFEGEKGPLLHVSTYDNDQLITGGTNKRLYISSNGGKTWNTTGEVGYHKNDLSVAPNGDMYHTWGYSGLWKSDNNGNTWNMTYDPDGFVASIDINLQGHILISTAVAGNNFHVSTDNGATWTVRPVPDDLRPDDVKYLTDTRAIAWKGGDILETSDGGLSWEVADLGFAGGINNVVSTNDGSIWVLTTSKGYKSSDQGITWSEIVLPHSSTSDITFLDESMGWLISGENGGGNIHFTEDGGLTWTMVDNSDFRFNAITVSNSVIPEIIAVGDGGIIRRLSLDPNSSVTYTNVESLNMYPNPGLDILQINEVQAEASVTIYNGQGEKVFFKDYPEGESIAIATHSFADGMYFVSMVSNGTFYRGSWMKAE